MIEPGQSSPTPQPGSPQCTLFLGALNQPTAAARAAYLEQACGGDTVLRASVEALLQSHEEDGFLEKPALVPPRSSPSAGPDSGLALAGSERAGDVIGRYRLIEPLGEGGVGTVFLAEQLEPVRRQVALKVLKPGMDTRSVIARFETERQALAMMDHPNIARVLDAGTTESGRPYFVMELVRGVRITEYCDRHRLGLRERLGLFIQVCQAIQHAHLKGIIHRDVKPSNILVTRPEAAGGNACPKVIDFGIAKATAQHLSDKSVSTELKAFIGTPAYMSPEQADMGGTDIDTRTDIYSLGALLYELITGAPPFDAQELVASGLDELRRIIREREPVPPTTRVRRAQVKAGSEPARQPSGAGSGLTRAPRGDLDCIVLKALEKDREQRYDTASSLAADVQRFLNDEPILARPPSAVYRCRKLVRRNKLSFAIAAAFAAALVLGLAASVWQYREKSRAFQRATDAERTQSLLREEAERQSTVARRKSYAADINLVQQALVANNLGRAQELLDGLRPVESRTGAKLAAGLDLRGWEWRYLWQHCQSDALYTLCQHAGAITSLAVSADGHWVAVGDSEGGLSMWDVRGREEVARLQAGGDRVQVAFSPAEGLLAFSAAEGTAFPGRPETVRLWRVAERRFLPELALGGPCLRLTFSQDGERLMIASGNGELSLWRVADSQRLRTWRLPQMQRAGPVQVAPDFSVVAYGVDGGWLRVFDLATGELRWSARAAEELVTALAFTPNGRWLASGAGYVESGIRLWDAMTGEIRARLEGHRTWVSSLRFLPDGRSLVSASGDQTIRIWDLAPASGPAEPAQVAAAGAAWMPPLAPQTRATLRGHKLEVWSLALFPDSSRIVSGCKDGTVCVWDVAPLHRDQTRVVLPGSVQAWTFAPDSRSVVTLDPRGRVVRWSGGGFQESRIEQELGEGIFMARFSPDSRWLVATRADGGMQLWDLTARRLQQEWRSEGVGPFPVSFVPSTGHLLTREFGEEALAEWDVASGQAVHTWLSDQEYGPGSIVALSGEGEWAYLLDADGVSRMQNLHSGVESVLNTGLKQITQAAFSPDGRRFAAVSWQGTGELWETQTLRRITALHGFVQSMNSVTFSPDSRRLAIGGDGNEAVKLWDVDSLQELLTLEGLGSGFHTVAFSPDGNVLGASNVHGALHLWRAPSQEEIRGRE